jgi:hypothetical protein
MEADLLPSVWRACIGFALSQIAVAVLMLALSAADPKVSSLDLRGSIEPPVHPALPAPTAFSGH